MAEKIKEMVRYYVCGLFRGVAGNEKIREQQEELIAHIEDRIAFGCERGLSAEAAFKEATEALGNLDEVVETIIGNKRSIYLHKANFFKMFATLLYGTLYMLGVGIWFAYSGLGFRALLIALPGWLGYAIPALISFLDYLRRPNERALVEIDSSRKVRLSIIGWISISLASIAVNFAFMETQTWLRVFWAWMPVAGILTWPLMNIFSAWMVRSLASIQAEREF